MLQALIEAGMNVARLNFAHGDHAQHAAVIARIRALGERLGVPVAVLQDLAGPKVRLGPVAGGGVVLQAGQPFVLTTEPADGSGDRVSVSYAGLPGEVKPGDALLLADGAIQLRVESVTDSEVRCRVLVGGRLSARKGVNVPSGLSRLPIMDDQDRADLRFGLEQGVDYLGLSFVRTLDDVRTVRAEVEALGGRAPLIAKIETQAALDHFDAIADAADGIMVARGDLSLETPFTHVPVVQKRLIARTKARAKPVITATQMLYSMVSSPQPTRAEAADVANAILDGSDAVMLSEETAVGQYPVRAVEVMAAIAVDTEGAGLPEARAADSTDPPTEDEALVQAACELAARLGSEAIVTVGAGDATARLAAKYRPGPPILALTGEAATHRRLALVRGVLPLLVPAASEDGDVLEVARSALHARGWGGRRAVLVTAGRIRNVTL
jgi:pyruvate kinase